MNATVLFFVEVRVEQVKPRKCTKCHELKDIKNDFYVCKGITRGECKRCTVKTNVLYRRKKGPTYHTTDPQERKAYMKKYYDANKEKFAEYRHTFKERHPEYYKKYHRDHKNSPRDK